MMTKSTIDFLLNLANEAVRLIGGYAVIFAPMLIPLAPVSIITLLLYNTILVDIPTVALRLIVCLLIGLGLESFALACLVVSRHAEEFNLTKEADEPLLSQNIGRWALAAYIVLGLAMVLVGEILPHYQWLQSAQIGRYTLLGFFLLAPFGHWVFSTEATIRRLEARRLERQAAAEAAREKDLANATAEINLSERQASVQLQRAQARALELQAEASLHKARASELRAERQRERPVQAKRRERTVRQARSQIGLDEFLATIGEHAGDDEFGLNEVQSWIDAGRTSIYKYLAEAESRGKVQRVGRGQYRYLNGVERDGIA